MESQTRESKEGLKSDSRRPQDCAGKALEAVLAVGVAIGECCEEKDRMS